MQQFQTHEFDVLHPPVVEQPSFTPPVADPIVETDTQASVPPPPPPPFRVTEPFISKKAALIAAVVLVVGGLTAGLVAMVGKADRLDSELTKTKADLTSTRADLSKASGDLASARSEVYNLRSENTDLTDSNDRLLEFGAEVSSLVADLDQCVTLTDEFIGDIADGYFWSSGDIRRLSTFCNEAQAGAAALDNMLTS